MHYVSIADTRWESETALTAAAATGDQDACRDLVALLQPRIRNLCVFLAGRRHDPDDLAQNVLMEILQSAGSFRGESSLARWADRIAVHTGARVVEKRQRRDRLWERHGRELNEGDARSPDELTDRKVKVRLALLLSTLPDERRTAMVLHHVQGYSIAEVAQMTDALPNTVRDRLQVGRSELRALILNDPVLREWRAGR